MLLSPFVEKHLLKKDKQTDNGTAAEVQKEEQLSDELQSEEFIDNNKNKE